MFLCLLNGGVDRFCLGDMGSLTVKVFSRNIPWSLLGGSLQGSRGAFGLWADRSP